MWEKGYQETDSVVSSVTTKVKGVTMTNTSDLGPRVWDVADYMIPSQVSLWETNVVVLADLEGFLPLISTNRVQWVSWLATSSFCCEPLRMMMFGFYEKAMMLLATEVATLSEIRDKWRNVCPSVSKLCLQAHSCIRSKIPYLLVHIFLPTTCNSSCT